MHKHIKMYGEDFELVSDPFVEGDYTTVHAISRNDLKVRELRLPVSILIGLPDLFRQRAKFAGQRLYGFVRTARDGLVSHRSRVVNIEQTAGFPFNYGPASGLPSAHYQIRKTEERQKPGLIEADMFYYIWLLAAGLAGWASGKITRNDGFGTTADILLGITGAFVVRWSLENAGVSLANVYLLLFSIWGAAAFPAVVRLGLRRHRQSKERSSLRSN